MATVSVVFTKLANAPADFISTSLASETLASGAATAASNVAYNYVMLTALGGNAWAAFTDDGSVPNPANAAKRIPLPQDSPMVIAIKKGTRVGVVDMA